MKSYSELLHENNYLKSCLSLDDFVYAVCIGVDQDKVYTLGCIKFLNGVDHYRSRDKMFLNIDCKKYWALVEEDVYKRFNNGKCSFIVK